MKAGQLDDAERRALNILDAWLENTGVVDKGSGYYYELQGVIEDAVRCGAQAAAGVHEQLSSEFYLLSSEIKFSNRAKKSEGDCAAQTRAQFAAFAALCASIGVASHVRGVEYSSNWCGYSIDVDPMHEHTQIGGRIEWAAALTLPQFEIFGRVEHKGGLEDDA